MSFDVKAFWDFCSQLRIASKEEGEILFDRPNGCQRYFIDEVAKGMEEGVHIFITLKGRQLGLSTVMLALDLYWIFLHPAIEATVIVQDEKMREKFRSDIVTMYETLPKAWRNSMETDNRNQMTFKNAEGQRAKFIWQIASERSDTKLGRGTGITFMHSTEVSSWGCSPEAIVSLENSFAETNPDRLFVYESTAEGYNMFYDMWETAKNSVTRKAVFVPWWLNERYSVSDSGETEMVFKTYFGTKRDGGIWQYLDAEERQIWLRVKHLYDYEPTPEQVAWMRLRIHEKCNDNLKMFLQEMPCSEIDAFQVTGSQFFPGDALGAMLVEAKNIPCDYFRVKFGRNFEDTTVEQCAEQYANLFVWEAPVEDASKGLAHYTLGADPAYGSSEWADRFVLDVHRCYSDSTKQVAQFCTENCTPTQFAWAICYLAGWYDNTIVNLELTGPGQVVLQELEQMRMMPMTLPDKEERKSYRNALRNIYQYRFFKYNGQAMVQTCRHWQSTNESKWRMFTTLRDCVARGICEINCEETIEEMMGVVTDGSSVGADGRRKDDRVVAAGLAHVAWIDNVRAKLMRLGITRKVAQERAGKENKGHTMNSMLVTRYLQNRKIVGKPKANH